MPLDLINIGAEANDGTGDTPRAAGVKINAAIAVVNDLAEAPAPVDYSGAIAAIETTQGTQTGAIAALALDVDALETSQAGQDSAIAQFETTAQLNARDTVNRARDNHTGTQPAGTITGLAAVATSGAYADLSGQPTIPVAGELSNNTRINGVEHFYQNAKPTTRGDASALVVGDRWWKIGEGSECFWNGTYWLSAEQYAAPGLAGTNVQGGNNGIFYGASSQTRDIHIPFNAFLSSYRVSYLASRLDGAANHFRLTTSISGLAAPSYLSSTELFSTSTTILGSSLITTFNINVVNATSLRILTICEQIGTLSAQSMYLASTLFYRLISP